MRKHIKKIPLQHILKITIEGAILWFIGMSLTAAIVSITPFSVFINMHESGYLDQNSPVSELLFLSNRTALFEIKASAIREIHKIDEDVIKQHPEVIMTSFVYETENNGQDLLITLPFDKFTIVDKGLYNVSETVTLNIPVGLLNIKKSHTFNNGNFNVL